MGINGHQISISLVTVQTWVLKDTNDIQTCIYGTYMGTTYGTDMGIKGPKPNQYITSYGTDMGINGHQISISLATVQTWVLKDTKSVYH